MKFSIIIPVYNTEKYLSQCIDSVLRQQCDNYEAILIDDGSTDGSPGICDVYAKNADRFTVIHKKNGGVTSARKAGVEIAKGDYIVPLDSDEWFADDYLQEMSKVIDQVHPDVIVGGWMTMNDDDTGKKFDVKGFEKGMYSRERIESLIFPILFENGGGTAIPVQ